MSIVVQLPTSMGIAPVEQQDDDCSCTWLELNFVEKPGSSKDGLNTSTHSFGEYSAISFENSEKESSFKKGAGDRIKRGVTRAKSFDTIKKVSRSSSFQRKKVRKTKSFDGVADEFDEIKAAEESSTPQQDDAPKEKSSKKKKGVTRSKSSDAMKKISRSSSFQRKKLRKAKSFDGVADDFDGFGSVSECLNDESSNSKKKRMKKRTSLDNLSTSSSDSIDEHEKPLSASSSSSTNRRGGLMKQLSQKFTNSSHHKPAPRRNSLLVNISDDYSDDEEFALPSSTTSTNSSSGTNRRAGLMKQMSIKTGRMFLKDSSLQDKQSSDRRSLVSNALYNCMDDDDDDYIAQFESRQC